MAHHLYAGVAELADALDLDLAPYGVGFDSFTRICRSSSAVEYNLAKVGVAGSNPSSAPLFCRGGGTGRRTGLKILR